MKNFFMYTSLVLLILLLIVVIVYSIAVMDLAEKVKELDKPLTGLTMKVVNISDWIYTYVWMPIVGAGGTVIYFARRHFKKKKKALEQAAG